jgi:hypothetical protein
MDRYEMLKKMQEGYALAEFLTVPNGYVRLEEGGRLAVTTLNGVDGYKIMPSAWDTLYERYEKKGRVYARMSEAERLLDLERTHGYIPPGAEWRLYLYDGELWAAHSAQYSVVDAVEMARYALDALEGKATPVAASYRPELASVEFDMGAFTASIAEGTVGEGLLRDSRLYVETNDVGTVALRAYLRSSGSGRILIGEPISARHVGISAEDAAGMALKAIVTAEQAAARATELSGLPIYGLPHIMRAMRKAVRAAGLERLCGKAAEATLDEVEAMQPCELSAWEVILNIMSLLGRDETSGWGYERRLRVEIAIRRLYEEGFWERLSRESQA